jgi:hypothetical protein
MTAVISFIQESPAYYYLVANAPERHLLSSRYSSPF